jgi:hypothetical protein
MICATYSSLAKIFQPYFHVYDTSSGKPVIIETVTRDQLMKTPDRIFKEEVFSVIVRRDSGDVHFISGRPRNITDQLLRWWLSGGVNCQEVQETDEYGVVELPIDPETQGALTYFLANPHDKASKGIQEALVDASARAREMSRERVLKSCRQVYKALKKQYELNEEQKLGRYPPSPVEFLCAYALASDMAKEQNEKQEITDRFAELMKATVG